MSSRWQDPPATGAGRKTASAWTDEAESLRENPGRWKIVKVYPTAKDITARAVGSGIRNGRYTAFRPVGAWEARTATENDPDTPGRKVVNVYARFIGESGEHAVGHAKDEDDDARKFLSRLPVSDLRGAAKDLGVAGYTQMRKSELVEVIAQHTNAA